ncbi:MAG: phosphohydrolase, partial [Candidatus Omnitrophota bacterium]|nr:phosphohydrolase [Candidatus Omnitrophota bacterium]
TPTMSKLIIMNHIKEGLELAKKYSLSPVLWDFIQQHHGNSLVYYFYRRALEGKEENQEVAEEGFRYPGPKPNSKETAIVLLADSVEAATRSLKDPTPDKIVESVHKVINNKFIDGQLDECELTLKDIEKISSVFSKILTGIYHSRVNYSSEAKG